ncbi:MAG TPA: PepSY domain-containing protein [Cellvibrionaceae bacterium]
MINQDAAIAIARQWAAQQGWSFTDPIDVVSRRSWRGQVLRYEIATNAAQRGTKARFVIDAQTGAVIDSGYLAR